MDRQQNNSSPPQSRALTLPIEGFSGSDHSTHTTLMISATSRERPILLPDCELFGPAEILPTLSSHHFPATPVAQPLALTFRKCSRLFQWTERDSSGHLEPGGIVGPLPALSGANGSRALAINDRGDVVGVSEMPSGPRATLWAAPRGTAQDLGTLPGHGVSEALSIMRAAMSSDLLGIYNNAAPCSGLKAAPSEIWGPFQAALRAGR